MQTQVQGWRDRLSGLVEIRHAQRGKLLFRVPAEKQFQRRLWIVVAAILAVACGYYTERRSVSAMSMFFAGYAVTLLFSRYVIFYDEGIYFPQEPSGGRARFIPWGGIERFHWEGDALTIVPATSLLHGGVSSVGDSLLGGTVRVPPRRRAQVEKLLAESQRTGQAF